MKKNRTVLTVFLLIMTVALVVTTFYISTLLSSGNSPTQIQKTKASAVTYSRTVSLPDFGSTGDPAPTDSTPAPALSPTVVQSTSTVAPSKAPSQTPSRTPTLLAQAPTLVPTAVPTLKPTLVPPTDVPTAIIEPTEPPTPTLSPLLAYKSTGGVSPTLIPLGENTDVTAKPTAKAYPTGSSQLPQTGWIQTSSILFIVATSTILFSLLF